MSVLHHRFVVSVRREKRHLIARPARATSEMAEAHTGLLFCNSNLLARFLVASRACSFNSSRPGRRVGSDSFCLTSRLRRPTGLEFRIWKAHRAPADPTVSWSLRTPSAFEDCE